jgi:hypothetical protein
MSDTVKRLRDYDFDDKKGFGVYPPEHLISDAADEIEDLRAEIDLLRGVLKEAIEEIEFWSAYASDYFKDKYEYTRRLELIRDVLEEKKR